MNIQVAVLCDAATNTNEKLNLLGAFDSIMTQQLPAIQPMCSVALRMIFGHTEEGAHQLRLSFVDEDGQGIIPAIDLPIDVTLPEDAHFVTRNIVVTFQQLKFDKPGSYSIDVSLDGQQQTSIPLFVKYVPAAS
jgi:hypothetical protein